MFSHDEQIYSKSDVPQRIRNQKLLDELKSIDMAIGLMIYFKDEKILSFISGTILESIEKINHYLNEPMLGFFPDIHLWLYNENMPIGICNIRSCDVLWSNDELQRGSICNQFIYLDIKVIL